MLLREARCCYSKVLLQQECCYGMSVATARCCYSKSAVMVCVDIEKVMLSQLRVLLWHECCCSKGDVMVSKSSVMV